MPRTTKKTASKAAPKPRVSKAISKKPEATDVNIAHAMTHSVSVTELAKAFGLDAKEIQARLTKGLSGYDIISAPRNGFGETFIAVPRAKEGRPHLRVWSYVKAAVKDQPYVAIQFPDDVPQSRTEKQPRLRIIPIDGCWFGDEPFDAERFDLVVKAIARNPNMFCYLNGDAIAEVLGIKGKGARQIMEEMLMQRAVEFGEKLAPIAHKILWAQRGCIEKRSLMKMGFDPLQYFCERHGIQYFTQPVYADILWKKHIFSIWTMHGHSTAQVKGAKINSLARPANVQNFTNFIVGGHIGDAIWNRKIKLCRDPRTCAIVPREEFHVTLGNFRKYFGTRAAVRGETPASNEVVVFYCYDDGITHVKTRSGGFV
jgi:hypothetical protein